MVTLSTAEAEYVAATEAVKEVIWIAGMLKELKISEEVVTVFSDSQSALHLCRNPVFHDRTKHDIIVCHLLCHFRYYKRHGVYNNVLETT